MKRISIVIACALLTPQSSWGQEPRSIGFNDVIRPILTDHCFACHGPDGASRKGDLRLDQPTSSANGVIVPGNAKKSKLIARINSNDPDMVMPPPGKRKALNAKQKKLLRDWINSGAKFEKHWAFIKPTRPALPVTTTAKAWPGNPIDQFLRGKMSELGLKPNAEANRYVLARRAALDLTGLPPTKAQVRDFVTDKKPNAYARYIERLLTSQHAGEHRARFWLDAARYGDTHGMHVDNYREIWPYRDWVVRAFNRNMPFDQFVIEQVAGDLLPRATLQQRIATGFSRCNITTSEGGAIPEELNVRYMIDRVETTATVFLGLTAGCAVCHDHKYDPIRQSEFYQLGAFFNNTTQPAMDGNQKDTPPVVTLPPPRFAKEWRAIVQRRNRLNRQLSGIKSNVSQWWASRDQRRKPFSDPKLVLSLPLSKVDKPVIRLPAAASWATDHPAGQRGIRFGNQGGISADMPPLRTDEPLSVSFWFRTPNEVLGLNLFDGTSKNSKKKTIGWKITGNTQGGLQFEYHDGQGQRIRGLLPGDEALKRQSWQHVCVRYSGGQSNSSISILVNGRVGRLRNSSEDLISATPVPAARLRIGRILPTSSLSDIRIFRRWVSDREVAVLARDYQLIKLLQSNTSWSKLATPAKDLLTRYHQTSIDQRFRAPLRDLAKTERRRDFIYSRSTTTLVMQEKPTQPEAFVLRRGEYDQRGKRVTAAVPAVLNFPGTSFFKPAAKRSLNRSDLAKWLVHPDHPLTARVMVNRIWQSVFGVGIVKTSEDFGVMGDRPSHPKLLDWLAVEFVESGWDVNHMLRLIVTSAAYRQDAKVTLSEWKQDRFNRFLARGPRIRLDAEVLRDQALAVSGLLQRRIGGQSVKPYQPAGLWNVVAITGSNTRYFKRDNGLALYRRSLYTFWKRTSPPPSMAAFNAPTREQCTVRRERTNTPLQALVLMNDPQFMEAARALAEQALRSNRKDRDRARWLLTTVLGRPATKLDMKDMTAAAEDFKRIFRNRKKVAKSLIRTGDTKPDDKLDAATVAAWTMVANTLMNRDDFVTK